METQKQKLAVQRIVNQIPNSDRKAVEIWLEKLLRLSRSAVGKVDKVKEAIRITKGSNVILPIVKIIGIELKRIGWDERTWSARLALSGAVIGAIAFSGEGAGIAAFGTAVGVPVWIVLGGGGAFAGMILDQIRKSSANGPSD